jgi:hypothetical protein
MPRAALCADPPADFCGSRVPQLWNAVARRITFGNTAMVAFLLTQCLDGIFTYVGVATYGIGVEANPLIAALMTAFGNGPGLVGAKLVASGLGILLHLYEIHGAIAILSAFYLAVAVLPWSALLFF